MPSCSGDHPVRSGHVRVAGAISCRQDDLPAAGLGHDGNMSKTSADEMEWAVPRGLIVLLSAAAAVLVVAGIRAAAGIIGPVFLAMVLTIAISPLGRYLRRRGWPSWVGTTVGIVASYVVLIGIVLSLVYALTRFATMLPQYQEDLTALVRSATSALTRVGVDPAQIDHVSGSFDPDKLASSVTALAVRSARGAVEPVLPPPASAVPGGRRRELPGQARRPSLGARPDRLGRGVVRRRAPGGTWWWPRCSASSWPCWTRSSSSSRRFPTPWSGGSWPSSRTTSPMSASSWGSSRPRCWAFSRAVPGSCCW